LGGTISPPIVIVRSMQPWIGTAFSLYGTGRAAGLPFFAMTIFARGFRIPSVRPKDRALNRPAKILARVCPVVAACR